MLNSLLNNFKKRNNSNHDENQYLNTIEFIINNGKLISGRNGNVYTIIGCPMHFSLENNIVPIITTKRVAIKTCIKELIWYIKGQNSNNILQACSS